MPAGSLYVARSPDYPGLVKVGFTSHDAASRVKRLSGAGSLARWELVASRPVNDARRAEKTCHGVLEQLDARVNPRREFFQIDEASAIRALDGVARQFPPRPASFAKTGHAVSGWVFPAKWQGLIALQRRHSNKTVSLGAILSEHIVESSHLAEGRLAKLGVVCVNRCESAVTYRIEPARAGNLIEELLLSGDVATAELLTSGSLMTVSISRNTRRA